MKACRERSLLPLTRFQPAPRLKNFASLCKKNCARKSRAIDYCGKRALVSIYFAINSFGLRNCSKSAGAYIYQ